MKGSIICIITMMVALSSLASATNLADQRAKEQFDSMSEVLSYENGPGQLIITKINDEYSCTYTKNNNSKFSGYGTESYACVLLSEEDASSYNMNLSCVNSKISTSVCRENIKAALEFLGCKHTVQSCSQNNTCIVTSSNCMHTKSSTFSESCFEDEEEITVPRSFGVNNGYGFSIFSDISPKFFFSRKLCKVQ